jgi:hypothetical protein
MAGWRKHPTPPDPREIAPTRPYDTPVPVDPGITGSDLETAEVDRVLPGDDVPLERVPQSVMTATSVHELAYLVRTQVDARRNKEALETLPKLVEMILRLTAQIRRGE